MPAVARRDAERLLRFVSLADELATEEAFTPETLTEFGRLVEADCVAYCELDRVRRLERAFVTRDPSEYDGEWSPEHAAEWWDVITYEHPICVRHQRGQFEAMKLSDFLTLRELKQTRMYRLGYEGTGVQHTIEVDLPSLPWHTKTFMFDRARPDFSERDRLVLDLLQPHLARIWNGVRVRRMLAVALVALGESPEAEARGVILLGPQSAADYVSPSAARLLREFYGAAAGALPAPVAGWLESPGLSPLVVRAGGRRLTIERAGDALLLGEAPNVDLTPREQQVLAWVARGKTNAEVAELLWLAPGTVRKHLENAFAKLGVRTRTAAVARFLALVDPTEDQPAARRAQSV